MREFDTRLYRKVCLGAGALHERGKAGHVVSLDVRLEHGRDRRSNSGRIVEVLIHEVGVWIDDRELAVRQAAEEVAGARALVVQERAQDHRRSPRASGGHRDRQPGPSPFGKADIEPASRASARPQQPHRVVGIHAIGPAAIRDHLHPAWDDIQRDRELVDRRGHGIWHMAGAILRAWPHVEEHDATVGEARGNVGMPTRSTSRAVAEIRLGQHLDGRDVLGRDVAHCHPEVHHSPARRAVKDTRTIATAAHEPSLREDLQVLRRIRDALTDLCGDLVDRTFALRQHVDDLGAPAIAERLRHRCERANSSSLAGLRCMPGRFQVNA